MVDEMKEGIMGDDRKGTWEDVTGECKVKPNYTGCGFGGGVYVEHDENLVISYGAEAHDESGVGYRVSFSNDRYQGYFKVEHFIPDPEPVIAYKAVIERDGEYVSTFTGGDHDGARKYGSLTYRVGEVTESTEGGGVFCFDTLEATQRAYPADRSASHILRKEGRVVILKVEGIEDMSPDNLTHNRYYKSVKALSVAWEEERKEEWVDVTEDCTVRLGERGSVVVCHNGVAVLSFGERVYKEETNCGRHGYRVTFEGGDFQGHFKVEKRND